jgi:hypothetical protein
VDADTKAKLRAAAENSAKGVWSAALNLDSMHEAILALLDELDAAADRERAAFDRGQKVGREGLGKYANAIGLIEAVLGIAGAQPLPETVRAVEALAKERDELRAVVEQVRGLAAEWRSGNDGMRTTSTVCAEELEAVLPKEGT